MRKIKSILRPNVVFDLDYLLSYSVNINITVDEILNQANHVRNEMVDQYERR